MDYLVGFLVGLFCKSFIDWIKELSEYNLTSYNYEYIDPLTEDDLP
tara:strand:- start:8540 stop:8677 length:138 start_codon:yes stop_codon:yes gene_type:complete